MLFQKVLFYIAILAFLFCCYALKVKENDHILPLKINLYQLHAFGQLFCNKAVKVCENKNIHRQLEQNLLFSVIDQFC